jgi:hypothetical protein
VQEPVSGATFNDVLVLDTTKWEWAEVEVRATNVWVAGCAWRRVLYAVIPRREAHWCHEDHLPRTSEACSRRHQYDRRCSKHSCIHVWSEHPDRLSETPCIAGLAIPPTLQCWHRGFVCCFL